MSQNSSQSTRDDTKPGLLSDAEYKAMMSEMQEAGDWMAAQLRARSAKQRKPEPLAE